MDWVPDEKRSVRRPFAMAGLSLGAATGWVVWDETVTRRPWKEFQAAWVAAHPGAEARIEQVVVPALGAVDRCPTCHAGIDTAEGAGDADDPVSRALRPHPRREELFGAHPVARFGCVSCHGGRGLALTAGTAHGDDLLDWPDSLLPADWREAACERCHAGDGPLEGAPALSRGRALFRELGCDGCHTMGDRARAGRQGPSLVHVADKLHPGELLAWIRDPEPRSAGGRMPRFWAEEDLHRERESLAIAAFLIQASEPWEAATAAPETDPALETEGRRIFDRVGCRGCHAIGIEGEDVLDIREGTEEEAAARRESDAAWASFGSEEEEEPDAVASDDDGLPFAPDLGRSGARLRPAFAFAWTRDPRDYWETARMPSLSLSADEARAVASWLATLGTSERAADPPELTGPIDPALAAEGKDLVAKYGCSGCHEIPGFEDEPPVGADLADIGRKPVSEMFFGDALAPGEERTWETFVTTKLRTPRAFATAEIEQLMPDYELDQQGAHDLAVFLRGVGGDPPAGYRAVPMDRAARVEAGARLLAERNCQGCHTWGDREGDVLANYGDRYLGPPTLEGEGARVLPQWLLGYLLDPRPLRPWLEIRMPSFDLAPEEAEALVVFFGDAAGETSLVRANPVGKMDPARAREGERLFTEAKCLSCHLLSAKGDVKTADLAPDLGLARQRLLADWVRRLVDDPNALIPDTKMPQFFPEGEAPFPDVLSGDVEAQKELLVDHVMNLGLLPVAER